MVDGCLVARLEYMCTAGPQHVAESLPKQSLGAPVMKERKLVFCFFKFVCDLMLCNLENA